MHERRAAAWGAGTGVGFATMTANAAGAVMTLYLSASGIDKRRFVGTNAWFFLIVNLAKVPFSIGLGLMHPVDAVRAVVLAPVVLLGGLLGYATVTRISQRRFDLAVLAASALAAGPSCSSEPTTGCTGPCDAARHAGSAAQAGGCSTG